MAASPQSVPWTVDLTNSANFTAEFVPTAEDRRVLRRINKAYQPQPRCGLLSLPAELRIPIYTLVALNTDSVALASNCISGVASNRIAVPSLGRVCRQIAREYCDIHAEIAVRAAPEIKLRFTRFEYPHINWSLQRLSVSLPSRSPGLGRYERRYIVVLFLSNEILYRQDTCWMWPYASECWWRTEGRYTVKLKIEFDRHSFDLALCRSKLATWSRFTGWRVRASPDHEFLSALTAAVEQAEAAQGRGRRTKKLKRRR
jgi:hypothetical protein